MRPKILYITPHWPFGHFCGGQQRTLNIARLLSRFGDVSFVIVSSELEDPETPRRTLREFQVPLVAHPLPLAKGNLFQNFRQRLGHEFDPAHFATIPYAVSESGRSALLKLLEQYDVTWIYSVKTANLFRINRWPHSILDADDILSRVYASTGQVEHNPIRRLMDLRMSWIWRRRESLFLKRFDAVTVCSENDRRYLGSRPRIHLVPNGFNPMPTDRHVAPEFPRIGFIGDCNFPPNARGLDWFIRDVWPLVKRGFPSVQLRIVGRGSDGEISKSGPDIVGLGLVEDPSEEIASWSAMIVPILWGGGTRIKTVEAFARRCPVVTTSIGAFGYDVHDGAELLLSDRAEGFASACVQLLQNPQMGEALAERAYKRFLKEWTWDSYEGSVGAAIHDCLAGSGRSVPEQATLAKALR